MKHIKLISVFLLCLFALVGCSGGDVWQEQYDLGMRYMSEGNYIEAIIAFDKAIEIDAKRLPAYVGRADAYIGSGEMEENLIKALEGYQLAIELDETSAEAWLGIVDVYIRQGEYDKVSEVLKEALEKTNNSELIANRIKEISSGIIKDSSGNRRISKMPEGNNGYKINIYNSRGILTKELHYFANGILSNYAIHEHDTKGYIMKSSHYDADDTLLVYDSYEYYVNNNALTSKRSHYQGNGELIYYSINEFDDNGVIIKTSTYSPNGSLLSYFINEYAKNGNGVRTSYYDGNGNLLNYTEY